MKTRILSFMIIAIMAVGAAFAQRPVMLQHNVQQELAMEKAEELRRELSLNEEQRLEVYNIYHNYAKKHNPTTDLDDDRRNIRRIYSDNNSEINREIENVLRPNQRNKFRTYQDRNR